jgi:hypothetical protein
VIALKELGSLMIVLTENPGKMVFPSSITKRAKERLRKKVGIQLLKINNNIKRRLMVFGPETN